MPFFLSGGTHTLLSFDSLLLFFSMRVLQKITAHANRKRGLRRPTGQPRDAPVKVAFSSTDCPSPGTWIETLVTSIDGRNDLIAESNSDEKKPGLLSAGSSAPPPSRERRRCLGLLLSSLLSTSSPNGARTTSSPSTVTCALNATRRDVGVFFCLVNVVTSSRRPPAERPAKYGLRGGGPRCHDAGVNDVQPYLKPAHRGPAHRHSDDVVIIVVGFIVVPIVVIIRRRRVEAAASLCRTNAGRRQGGDAVAVASSLVTYPSQSSKPTGEGLNCIQKATH